MPLSSGMISQNVLPISSNPYRATAVVNFNSVFEEECQKRKSKLFVLPLRSPQLNGVVERANRTHAEEFYEVIDSTFDLANIRPELLQWEQVSNTIRLNQDLRYLTPQQNLEKYYKKVMCH